MQHVFIVSNSNNSLACYFTGSQAVTTALPPCGFSLFLIKVPTHLFIAHNVEPSQFRAINLVAPSPVHSHQCPHVSFKTAWKLGVLFRTYIQSCKHAMWVVAIKNIDISRFPAAKYFLKTIIPSQDWRKESPCGNSSTTLLLVWICPHRLNFSFVFPFHLLPTLQVSWNSFFGILEKDSWEPFCHFTVLLGGIVFCSSIIIFLLRKVSCSMAHLLLYSARKR